MLYNRRRRANLASEERSVAIVAIELHGDSRYGQKTCCAEEDKGDNEDELQGTVPAIRRRKYRDGEGHDRRLNAFPREGD